MRQLNIVHVVPYFTPAWAYGGIPRLAYELAREQGRMGHKVRVITTDALDAKHRHPEAGATLPLDDGVIEARYLRNVSNKLAYRDQLFLPIGLEKALKEMASDADIIHIHGHRHSLEVAAALWARKRGIPYVVTANGTAPRIERRERVKAIVDKLVADKLLIGAAACIAVSKAEIPQYLDRGVARERIHVIYNGIDVSAFENIPKRGLFRQSWKLTSDHMILYLGKITPRKGLIPLVKATEILASRMKVQLVIAGNDMEYLDVVKEEVKNRKLTGIVTYTGLVEGRDKRSAYVDADVTVYPSRHEIFGLVPFESILCGTPVVVSDDSGCGEIIGGEKIGETVPYGDVPALAVAIERVLRNPDEAHEKVKRGKKFIRSALDCGVIAASTVELYHKIVG